MEIIEAIGGVFERYGVDELDQGWVEGVWKPTQFACNPHGTVQAGVHSVLLDAAMNFAANTVLDGKDRTKATLEMKTELLRPATSGSIYKLRGEVVRISRQVAFTQAFVVDDTERPVSRSTGTFLLHREQTTGDSFLPNQLYT